MFKRFVALFIILGILMSFVSVTAMSTYQFDYGMKKGISYFNSGKYAEAIDEFQWFCDGNWADMNQGQREYVIEYLNAAKTKYQESLVVSKDEFDNGMKKGIEYYNKGMFLDARNEFQWFCDNNPEKMNEEMMKLYKEGHNRPNRRSIR